MSIRLKARVEQAFLMVIQSHSTALTEKPSLPTEWLYLEIFRALYFASVLCFCLLHLAKGFDASVFRVASFY